MKEGYKDNPRQISDQAVDNTLKYLSGDPLTDLTKFREQLNHIPFLDILYDEFQIFRMGSLGWSVDIPAETRERFGVKVTEIDTMGPDELEDDTEEAMDFFVGVGLLRAFIASAYVEQAKIDHSPTPDINDKVIDTLPVKKEDLDKVSASRKGMFVIDANDQENQWRQENPRLHQEAMGLKDRLVEKFSPGTFRLYKDLPTDFVNHFNPTLREEWDDCLRECAIRAYAWFTPNQPVLIPVRIRKKSERMST